MTALALVATLGCADDQNESSSPLVSSTIVETPAGESPMPASRDEVHAGGFDPDSPAYRGSDVDVELQITETPLGAILSDGMGMTLYFRLDQDDGWSCTNDCGPAWQPARVAGRVSLPDEVDLNVAVVADQLTVDGRGAYRFAGDARPGDTQGLFVEPGWSLITGEGKPVAGPFSGS